MNLKWNKRFLYGLLVGITSIAPGLSGGAIAIALGFYESLIGAVADFFRDIKKNILFLLPFGLGAIVSLALFSVALDYLFINYPLPASCLFIGFILGTLPFIKHSLYKTPDFAGLKARHIFLAAVFFLVALIPIFYGQAQDPGALSASAGGSVIGYFFTGILISVSLIVPGLSGTMILTSLGLYKPLLHTASTFITCILKLDFASALELFVYLVPLGIGAIAGVFLAAKVIKSLFARIPDCVYSAVLGLILATPLVMLSDITFGQVTIVAIIISVAAFIAGMITVLKIGEK